VSRARWFSWFAVVLIALGLAGHALALPRVGATRPAIKLMDGWERELDLATINKPLIIIYEDKDDGFQNQTLKDELVTLDKANGYRKLILQIIVVDLTPYNYWPARGLAKNEIQKWSNKVGMILYYDFTDSARSTLALTKGQSNVVMYDKAGAVQFAFAGAVPADKRKDLADLIRAYVATVTPAPATPAPSAKP
jgi:hypothetical protein